MKWLEIFNFKPKPQFKLPSGVFKGTQEAWEWLDDFSFSRYGYNKFVQPVHNMGVYKMLIECCDDKQNYELHRFIEKHGMDSGIEMFIGKMRTWRMRGEFHKKFEVDLQNRIAKRTVDTGELNQLVKEEQAKRKEAAEREKLQNEKTWLNDLEILKVLATKEPIEKKASNRGARYGIYDKIHGDFIAYVSADYREEEGLKPIIVRGKTIQELKTKLISIYTNEVSIQAGKYFAKEDAKKSSKRTATIIDIGHVKSAMGISMDNDAADILGDDDIF